MRKILVVIALAGLAGCKKETEAEKEPVVPVQVTEVTRGTIQQLVTGDGIVYPVNQASVVPKISAPIRSFTIKRGDHVAKNQLLATLENRDLEAAVAEARQIYEQAQAAQRTTTAAQIPEDATKAQQDVESTKEAMDAAQKVYESRKQLFEQGALARRLVEEANVAYVQARSQYDIASQHLQGAGRRQPAGAGEGRRGTDATRPKRGTMRPRRSFLIPKSTARSRAIIADRPLYAGRNGGCRNRRCSPW